MVLVWIRVYLIDDYNEEFGLLQKMKSFTTFSWSRITKYINFLCLCKTNLTILAPILYLQELSNPLAVELWLLMVFFFYDKKKWGKKLFMVMHYKIYLWNNTSSTDAGGSGVLVYCVCWWRQVYLFIVCACVTCRSSVVFFW